MDALIKFFDGKKTHLAAIAFAVAKLAGEDWEQAAHSLIEGIRTFLIDAGPSITVICFRLGLAKVGSLLKQFIETFEK